ncbi:hypothetical protein ED28_16220 [[Pantoea] beijingensis]|uniref:Type III secretion protein n=1 Tax=[Pantoea] beijingensis TaxID=1324864 RepID=A0A443IA80_9GAMM|nr:hypothetical protein [[Pantoea] beijingensis]RWR00994.1 hypothetical protein ED28_16220 [[Pantoea] beijingensis]
MNDAQAWVVWWTEGYWQQVEESWHSLAFFHQPQSLISRLLAMNPQLIAGQLGIDTRLPTAPHGLTRALLALSAEQRTVALRLTAGIGSFYPADAAAPPLDEEMLQWCKRIARALRPGVWLPEDLTLPWQITSLMLLRHALPQGCWQRVRFLFPSAWVVASEEIRDDEWAKNIMLINKLSPLWQAAFWRASLARTDTSDSLQETEYVAA